MNTLLQYIEKNWGKPQYCVECKSKSTLALCGGCFKHVYCSDSCQLSHWKVQHQYQCINGQTKRTGKEEEDEEEKEQEDDNPALKKRANVAQDERQELNLNDLSRDIWQKISFFLSGRDLKNLTLVDRIIQQRIRQQFIKRFRWIITSDMFENERFLQIIGAIEAVTISDQVSLNLLIERGAPVKDVKFGDYFNQPIALPQGLTHLTMGFEFNQPIALPQGLTHLTMGYEFDQPIILPEVLTHLAMGRLFNQRIILPEGLTHLTMGVYFNQRINFPNGLVYLRYYNWYYYRNRIPPNIPKIETYQ